ncbi:MAG: hypothetical protein JKY51_07185 [Opitutaceae bacterium]|nr:hypothetical protein [Opitutaceae bacterium]
MARDTIELKYRLGTSEKTDRLVARYLNANIPEEVKESFRALQGAQKYDNESSSSKEVEAIEGAQ